MNRFKGLSCHTVHWASPLGGTRATKPKLSGDLEKTPRVMPFVGEVSWLAVFDPTEKTLIRAAAIELTEEYHFSFQARCFLMLQFTQPSLFLPLQQGENYLESPFRGSRNSFKKKRPLLIVYAANEQHMAGNILSAAARTCHDGVIHRHEKTRQRRSLCVNE